MPLYYLESDEPISRIPHPQNWRLIERGVSPEARDAIESKLNEIFESDEIHTAGWIPGNNWEGTIWDPIYRAAGQSEVLSGQLFGLLVFEHAMRRDERWIVGRFEQNGETIRSLTYFRPA